MIEPQSSAEVKRSNRLRRAPRVLPVFLISSVLVLLSNVLPAQAASIGTITAVRGTVTLKKPGGPDSRVQVRGEEVSVGDDIGTGKNAAVQITFADGSFLNLLPDSVIRVNQFSFDARKNRRTARIRLLSGRARFVLYKVLSNDSAFFIEAGNARVAPGMIADFGVSTGPEDTEVIALGQAVRVMNSSQLIVGETSLGVNQKTVVQGKNAPSQPVTVSAEERNMYMLDMRRLKGF